MSKPSSRRHEKRGARVVLALIVTFGILAGACSPAEVSSPETSPPPPPSATPTLSSTTTTTTAAPTDETTTSAEADLDPVYTRAEAETSDRVADLLERMTLAEKIGQMTLVEKNSIVPDDIAAFGIGGLLSGGGGSPLENTPQAWAAMVDGFQDQALASRLGVPLIYGVDAVHGHNNVRGAVIFPHNIGLGAANDPDLMKRIGAVTATEMAATGAYWNYAPAVSVPQDVRWGRTYEGYSERTETVTALAAAYLRGLQGGDLGDPGSVLATPKHYLGDGGTTWGSSTTDTYAIDQGVTEVDEASLRAIHLPPYVRAIEEGARSIMASYSSWGDTKMHASRYLITDVLKGELGFGGFVVSDWGAVNQISDDYYEAVVAAINAGIDMNMVPSDYRGFISTLTRAVEAGDVSEERINDAARRILLAKLELGLFENPYSDPSLLNLVGSEEHREVAREAVAKSQVLLKNEGDLLPLSPGISTLFVGGRTADNIGFQSGGWTIAWQGASGDITEGTTIIEAIGNAVSADTTVIYDAAGTFPPADADEPMVCLAVVGETPYAEGRGDNGRLQLPPWDMTLVAQMRATCDQLAVILISGRPLIVTDLIGDWDALVAAWLPGTEGRGIADVLFGSVPFTATLPYTWPKSVDDLPLGSIGDQEALFPVGFGMTTGP